MPKNDNFYVYGRNPVEELTAGNIKSVSKVFVKNSIPPNSYQELLTLCKANYIPIVTVPEQKLTSLVGRVNHQGFVALRSPVEYADFFQWIETCDLTKNPAVLLLDGIEDPHNLGAILRTAAAANIDAVIVPAQQQAPVNATVFKTSAGTAGRIPIIRVHNTNQGFKDLKLAGFSIYSLDTSAQKTIWEMDIDKPVAFLIGNEGRGVSKHFLKKADDLFMLPMAHNVESLNASVTAALVSYEWRRKKSQ